MDQPKSSLSSALGAKSSWIFNCNVVTRRLKGAGSPPPVYFFRSDALNYAVLTKEILPRDEPPREDGSPVGTKIFMPFEIDNPRKGGRSVMIHNPKLKEFINDAIGMRNNANAEAYDTDIELLRTIDALPSLDAFLLRDALALQEFGAHEAYFELSPQEREAIQKFMREKMEKMVRTAFGGEKPAEAKVNQLINTLWEAKNLIALDPLIAALRCPRNDALSIFAAWKGVIFYSFDYFRSEEKRKLLGGWLGRHATPQPGLPVAQAQYHRERLHGIIQQLRHHWLSVDSALKNYDKIYDNFVTSLEPAGFIDFLRKATKVSYAIGISMGKIGQAVGCFEMTTKGNARAPLPPIVYDTLLGQISATLAAPQTADSAAA